MRDLIPHLPFAEVSFAICEPLNSRLRGEAIENRLHFKYRYEHSYNKLPWPLKTVGRLAAFSILFRRQARAIAKQILNHLRAKDISDVLIILESPILFEIARLLSKSRTHRTSTLVWDHPEHVISNYGYCGLVRDFLLKSFSKSIQASSAVITVATKLREHLRQMNPKAKVEAQKSPVSLSEDFVPLVSPTSGEFVIGYAGSVTAPQEFDTLLLHLDSINWAINGRSIRLKLFGKRFVLSSSSSRRIEYCGFRNTTHELIDELRKCNLLFLPQPFSAKLSLVSRYSFPTKLSTYLSSGCPILLFAPSDSSIVSELNPSLSDHWSFGVYCQQESGQPIPDLIRSISITDQSWSGRLLSTLQSDSSPFSMTNATRVMKELFAN